MGPGTLYGSLDRMQKAGLIEESTPPLTSEVSDKRRRYYRMTEHGRRVLKVETSRLEEAVRRARVKRVLSPA